MKNYWLFLCPGPELGRRYASAASRLTTQNRKNTNSLRTENAFLWKEGWLTDKSPVVAHGAAENTENHHKDAVLSVSPCEQIPIGAFCQSIRERGAKSGRAARRNRFLPLARRRTKRCCGQGKRNLPAACGGRSSGVLTGVQNAGLRCLLHAFAQEGWDIQVVGVVGLRLKSHCILLARPFLLGGADVVAGRRILGRMGRGLLGGAV